MRTLQYLSILTLLLLTGCHPSATKDTAGALPVRVDVDTAARRADIFIGGQPFTSFLYTDTLAALTKPVLWPVISAAGDTLTRGFPLHPVPGERTDHPHHIGIWFTYGNVNHIDFWGNSPAMPDSLRDRLGWIRNVKILEAAGGDSVGTLVYEASWQDFRGRPMLQEHTVLTFRGDRHDRFVERTTTLTALDDTIVFHDTKEGMMAIRVSHPLELPSDKPSTFTDEHGNVTIVGGARDTIANGDYLTSRGITGKDAWGKRAEWVCLHGKVNGQEESITIFDHPGNPGHPTYWHARGYGLFSVNPLGQKTFSKGKEELNLTLAPGESVTFRYGMLFHSGPVSKEMLDQYYQQYITP